MDSPSPPALVGRAAPPPPLPLLASAVGGWASACVAAALLPAGPLAAAATAAECTESRRASAFLGLRARACLLGTLRQPSMEPQLAGAATGTGMDDDAGTIVIGRVLHR